MRETVDYTRRHGKRLLDLSVPLQSLKIQSDWSVR